MMGRAKARLIAFGLGLSRRAIDLECLTSRPIAAIVRHQLSREGDMAVVGLIFAVLSGLAFWWWRIQMMRGAAESVIDVAGKAKGMISRARFKHRAGASV